LTQTSDRFCLLRVHEGQDACYEAFMPWRRSRGGSQTNQVVKS